MREIFFKIWLLIPVGYLLRFEYGGLPDSIQRVTLTKGLWVIIDSGDGTAQDALPLSFVSQELVDECESRLINKYKLKANQ